MSNIRSDNRMSEIKTCPAEIFINQLGYKPRGEKRAVMPFPCEAFSLCDKNGNTVYEGKATHFGYDESSGDDVYIADFSDFCEAGEYTVKSGERKSLCFRIDEGIYDKALHDISKAFYFLRCGCDLREEYGGAYIHPKCHTSLAHAQNDREYAKDVSGGWHDAGDYGRYVTSGAITVAQLLYAFIMFPESFKGQNLNIPESNNGIPDILNECKYELSWLLKMQREDGGVWHKCTTLTHAPFIMPQDDNNELLLFNVSSSATADFAAVCALASRVFEDYDGQFADTLLFAALKSYEWLRLNPELIGFENPEGCNTGIYGERSDTDNRFWASCEIYALTGDKKYHQDLLDLSQNIPFCEFGHSDVGGFGALSYILCNREKDDYLLSRIKNDFTLTAGFLAERSDSCGYGVAMFDGQYCWGSNLIVMKNAMIYIVADYLSGENKYEKYAARQLNYLFGVNALGYSYVSGHGDFAVKNLHLRTTIADGIEDCFPGLVSGGPNASHSDYVAKTLLSPDEKPMKCFIDSIECYSLNEVAIYWNSSAIFVLAWHKDKT